MYTEFAGPSGHDAFTLELTTFLKALRLPGALHEAMSLVGADFGQIACEAGLLKLPTTVLAASSASQWEFTLRHPTASGLWVAAAFRCHGDSPALLHEIAQEEPIYMATPGQGGEYYLERPLMSRVIGASADIAKLMIEAIKDAIITAATFGPIPDGMSSGSG